MGAASQESGRVRLLLAQTSFLGDVVLSTALARTLERAGRYEVWWLVRPEAAALLVPTWGDRVLRFDKRGRDRGWWGSRRVAAELRRHDFGVAIGVQRSVRTALLLARARIPLRVGFADSPGAWLYHRRVARVGAHARDRLVALATGLGVEPGVPPLDPQLDVDPAAAGRVDDRLVAEGAETGSPLLVVAPGSAWATKKWPAGHFAEAAAALARPGLDRVVVLGTSADGEAAERIVAEVRRRGGLPAIDATGGTSMADAVAWIARARLVLANDSAPAHVAAALHRPVVTMFGPTVPAQGFAPLGPEVRIAERDLACRPCSRHGGDRCPIGTHECLVDLRPEEVVSTAHDLLASHAGRGSG